MELAFRDKNQLVLIVDPAGSFRSTVNEVLKASGFQKTHGVANLHEAIEYLEAEPVGWIISSFFTEHHENLLKILKLVLDIPQLRDLRISALIEPSEFELLPQSFGLGLLSYSVKPVTKETFFNDIRVLNERMEALNWSSSLVAGTYLRSCLRQLGRYDELLHFEKRLLSLHPGDLHQLLNQVVPLIKLSRIDEAKAILSQVKILDSSMSHLVDEIITEYLGDVDLSVTEGQGVDVLGLKTVVIVDHDITVQNELKSTLEKLGVESIQIFDDGESAFTYLAQHPNPDLIVQEWKIPKLTGPIFLQRAKDEYAQHSIFILITSLIDKKDLPFMRELGISTVIAKPLHSQDLINSIIWAVQQDRLPTEQVTMEQKIRKLLKDKGFDEAEQIKMRYMSDEKIAVGAKNLIEAEFAYHQGWYRKARDFALDAIKNAGDSLIGLNLLGKSLYNLGELANALKCFQKAQSIAPKNLERLCRMAEIQSELGDFTAAKELIAQANVLDSKREKVKESEAIVAIHAGDERNAKKIMYHLRALENIVAYMNNQAVILAKYGSIQESIEQYEKTLQSLPEERTDLIGIVEYNLSLAYLRNQKLDEAVVHLIRSASLKDSKVVAKAKKLLARVEHAIKKGTQIHLSAIDRKIEAEDEGTGASGSSDFVENDAIRGEEIVRLVEPVPGEIGVYQIYSCQINHPRVDFMLKGEIRFNPRQVIEKEESFGVDKVNYSTG